MTVSEFDSWYRNEYRQVVAITTIATKCDFALAEDAAGDAFATSFERWEEVSQMDNPTGWVTRVAINNARSVLRRLRRLLLIGDEVLVRPSAEVPGLDDFWSRIDSLTRRQRAALALRYVDDLSQRQVAQRLGVSDGTASATLTQARQTIRKTLEDRNSDA